MIETTNVNTESAKSRACVLTGLRGWRAYVLACLACSRAWRAFVLACLTCVLAMMRAWYAQHWRTRVLV